ncbi:ABC transporter permease subunit [Anaeromicropila populeti]|uniref:ABC-2 family transporter protein n=1 Tax=Anaeromicropila populeti TaxID=37658 RepID=A0A1I6K9D4_9FIRM|nr:ABC transporter permease subunit [Anaeromicropila populeti]SFR87754.1 ABC-2 family transporter protein [Anaeromicropila populeti]
MMNYMKSEFYRTVRNRNLLILVAACTGLLISAVLVLNYFNQVEAQFPYGNTRFALSNVYMDMGLFLAVAVVFTGFVHDSEDKQHTMKHSVAFGIKRSTIFLGRFFSQIIVATLLYFVLVTLFTVVSFMLLPHSNQGELGILIRVSAGSITCLFASIAIAHCFLIVSESEMMAYLKAFSILFIIPDICNLIGHKVDFIKKLTVIFPVNIINSYSPLVTGEGNVTIEIIKSLLIGLIWVIVFLVLGVAKFNKKEVK